MNARERLAPAVARRLERDRSGALEARSYIVATISRGTAITAARDLAAGDRHPCPQHGSILWTENLGDGRWEVCIATSTGESA